MKNAKARTKSGNKDSNHSERFKSLSSLSGLMRDLMNERVFIFCGFNNVEIANRFEESAIKRQC